MSNLTLLYAGDDMESRNNYVYMLKKHFSEVYLVKDGREALILYYEKKPNVLLLDICRSFINGLEVAKTVRKENRGIPIIMLSAHIELEKLLTAIPLGLSAYLLKPIDDKQLTQSILKVIRERQEKETISLYKKLVWNKLNADLLYQEESVNLTRKEKRLMSFLCASIGEYSIHDSLILYIWDDEIPDASYNNKLHQLIYRLNKKINTITNSDKSLIKNNYTLGYKIDSLNQIVK